MFVEYRCYLELFYSWITSISDAGPSYSQPQEHERPKKRDGNPDTRQPAQLGAPGPVPSMNMPTVYNYVHPVTKRHIATLLPPDHPEMVCLQQGAHVPQTRYGLLGESFPRFLSSPLPDYSIPVFRYACSCILVSVRHWALPSRPQNEMCTLWTHD